MSFPNLINVFNRYINCVCILSMSFSQSSKLECSAVYIIQPVHKVPVLLLICTYIDHFSGWVVVGDTNIVCAT